MAYHTIEADKMRAEAFKPPDAKWAAMKAVYDACKLAGVDVPDLVEHFFNYEPPDDAGVSIGEGDLLTDGVITGWSDGNMSEGIEIHVDKIPPDVKVVRVYNSY